MKWTLSPTCFHAYHCVLKQYKQDVNACFLWKWKEGGSFSIVRKPFHQYMPEVAIFLVIQGTPCQERYKNWSVKITHRQSFEEIVTTTIVQTNCLAWKSSKKWNLYTNKMYKSVIYICVHKAMETLLFCLEWYHALAHEYENCH